ncbi:MAG: hypothetical protein K6U04_04265 [Armatimonadetes bacterium]|nr:hypothetical protein [Armatimonadota bacterium]
MAMFFIRGMDVCRKHLAGRIGKRRRCAAHRQTQEKVTKVKCFLGRFSGKSNGNR